MIISAVGIMTLKVRNLDIGIVQFEIANGSLPDLEGMARYILP